jgi:DNA-binding NarL/FixJ family response regulator
MSQEALVVDDDVARAIGHQHILTGKGFKVSTAYSYEEALAYSAKTRFDLALLDISLDPEAKVIRREVGNIPTAGQSGIQLAQSLRTRQPNIAIIFYSAYMMNYVHAVSELLYNQFKNNRIGYIAAGAGANRKLDAAITEVMRGAVYRDKDLLDASFPDSVRHRLTNLSTEDGFIVECLALKILPILTTDQREVLNMLTVGWSHQTIAENLDKTLNQVKTSWQRIQDKVKDCYPSTSLLFIESNEKDSLADRLRALFAHAFAIEQFLKTDL